MPRVQKKMARAAISGPERKIFYRSAQRQRGWPHWVRIRGATLPEGRVRLRWADARISSTPVAGLAVRVAILAKEIHQLMSADLLSCSSAFSRS
jgi:hypothetical protein